MAMNDHYDEQYDCSSDVTTTLHHRSYAYRAWVVRGLRGAECIASKPLVPASTLGSTESLA